MKETGRSGQDRTYYHLASEKGMALVLTLMILVLITAMVVEFAYGVYTSTSALYNWKEAQKLSFISKSGMSLAVKTISEAQQRNELYMYLGKQIPVENITEGFPGTVIVSAEDENGKFNLNSINRVWPDGSRKAYSIFVRLLRKLGLEESIADRVAYWIDKNKVPELLNSQEVTKNSYMDSVDELLLIRGVDAKTYETLLPYVTVYGYLGPDDSRININTASIPVIMCLNDSISKAMAEEVVNQRGLQPFEGSGDLQRAGFDKSLINFITTYILAGKKDPPANFRITSASEDNGIKRVIESVVNVSGSTRVLYWREM